MTDDELFSIIIKKVLEVFSEEELGDCFKVSQGTINRWSLGKNLPHKSIRKTILVRLYDKVIKLIKQDMGLE
jgi:hypothetical protein